MLAIVIPCYNEDKNIYAVVSVAKLHAERVIVVDDNSQDRSGEIASQAGAEVIKPDWERGQGGAGRTTMLGIHYAIDTGANLIITMDGDGQHSPSDLPYFKIALHDGYDVVCGFRMPEDIPLVRRVGNSILTLATNVGAEFNIRDTQCGFRAYNAKVFNDLEIQTNGFGFCSELIIKLRKKHYLFGEVLVKTIYHDNYKENSTLSPFRHAFLVGMSIIKWRLKSW